MVAIMNALCKGQLHQRIAHILKGGSYVSSLSSVSLIREQLNRMRTFNMFKLMRTSNKCELINAVANSSNKYITLNMLFRST